MLTGHQVKWLRNSLGKSQKDFAEMCNLSEPTIKTIEGDLTGVVTEKTETKVRRSMTPFPFRFTSTGGIEPKPKDHHEVIRGKEDFSLLHEAVYQELKSHDDKNVWVNNVNERDYLGHQGAQILLHTRRMIDLGVKYHILIEHGDTYAPCEYAEYRWTPLGDFVATSFYAFGDKAAIVNFEDDEPVARILYAPYLARDFKTMIKQQWDRANSVIGGVKTLA